MDAQQPTFEEINPMAQSIVVRPIGYAPVGSHQQPLMYVAQPMSASHASTPGAFVVNDIAQCPQGPPPQQLQPFQQLQQQQQPACPPPPPPTEPPGYAPRGVVPEDFARQCDGVFDSMPRVVGRPDLAQLGSARAVWSQYGEEEYYVDAVTRLTVSPDAAVASSRSMAMPLSKWLRTNLETDGLERQAALVAAAEGDAEADASYGDLGPAPGLPHPEGVSRQSFALGCYYLAARKPGTTPLPRTCTAREYAASGFVHSAVVHTMCQGREKNVFSGKLASTILLNILICILTLCWWMFGPMAVITLVFALSIYKLERRYPFILRNRDLARCVLAFGIMGCVANFVSFAFMLVYENDFLWALTWAGWETFQLIYAILSTISLYIMRNSITSLTSTAVLELPDLGTPPAHNSKAIFISAWAVLCVLSVPSIIMSFMSIAEPCLAGVSAMLVWCMMTPAGVCGIAMFAVLLQRDFLSKWSVAGLGASLVATLASVWLALPLLITASYCD
ncbi:hypothetical protein Pelo_6703 [Pelomyxa schiedti]|nr:hypothetical protein Pelo_6703 [Pelomyxa schiedti]